MRELVSAAYWAVTGSLVTFTFLFVVSPPLGLPFALISLVMVPVGFFLVGIKGTWALTIGSGAALAYTLLETFSDYPPDNYIVVAVICVAIALLGPAVRLLILMRGRLF